MAQINKSSEYFNTKLYTGNGSTVMQLQVLVFNLIGFGLKEEIASDNELYDAVRGATKNIEQITAAEATNSNRLLSFDSDGFTLGN
jgi:hypothetical protein